MAVAFSRFILPFQKDIETGVVLHRLVADRHIRTYSLGRSGGCKVYPKEHEYS